MSEENRRVCQVCGTPILPGRNFCPVCAFRGAMNAGDTVTELYDDPTPSRTEIRFEHYEVLTHEDGRPFELGRGAMGITYKAIDTDLRRFAALKVISPRYLNDESARLRFQREARVSASVGHPLFLLSPKQQPT